MNKYLIIYKMTGTNATIDGMGFDRVNQSDAQTDIIVGVSGLFSYISGATIIGASVPTDNIILTGSLSSLDVIATNGSFTGINIGSNAFIDGNLTSTNLDVGQTINTITGSFTQVQVSMLLDAKSDVNVGNNLRVTGSIVINSNDEDSNLVFTRGGTAVVEDDTISKIYYGDSGRTLASEELYVMNGSVGIETMGYSKQMLVSGTAITTWEVEGDADEMVVEYKLAGEGLSEVGFGLGGAEDDTDATASFNIFGQDAGEAPTAPGSGGRIGGNIFITGGDGSAGGGEGTDGGSGGNTYFAGGEGGEGVNAGDDGPYGEVFIGYNDEDAMNTIIGSNFFKFTDTPELLVMGSTALTGSYASSGTQFIEVKNGLIMGVI